MNYKNIVPKQWRFEISNEIELMDLGKANLYFLLEYWLDEFNKIKRSEKDANRDIQENIAELALMLRTAETKPAFPLWRPDDWFKEHDDIVLINPTKEIVSAIGHVEYSIKYSKIVNIWFDQCFKDGPIIRFGEKYSLHNPNLMHPWELKFLKTNRNFAMFYISTSIGNVSDFDDSSFIETIFDKIL